MAELSQMSDEEFMAAWDAAGARVAEAQAECEAFAADHQRRVLEAEEVRKAEKEAAVEAGEVDPSLDQTVGSPRAGLAFDTDGGN
jgi:hypothetical protein